MEYYYPNELYHYGVKGMKWGVRKSQSGSITGNKTSSNVARAYMYQTSKF